MRTTNGGRTWTTLLNVGANVAFSLSCSTAENCVVGGAVQGPLGLTATLWTTRDGGRSWTRQPFPVLPVPRGLRPCRFGDCSSST